MFPFLEVTSFAGWSRGQLKTFKELDFGAESDAIIQAQSGSTVGVGVALHVLSYALFGKRRSV